MTGEEAIKKLQERYAYNNKFNREKYDRITVMLPKGTKDRLVKTGQKTGTLIKELVLAYLDENGF